MPGNATFVEWTITVTPEGFVPVVLTHENESRNPSGFCAHRFECHPSYEGACMPNDGQGVHCAGSEGAGHAIEGPITVVGYDAFTLDPDGDGIACEPPAAAVAPAATPAAVRAQPAFTG